MTRPQSLAESDVRGIVRLLSEVNATAGDHVVKKRELMDGLATLIDADRWAWGMSAQMEPDKPSVHLSLVQGGFDDESFAIFVQAYSHPEMSAIHAPFAAELAARRTHLTRLRQQIDPTGAYEKTAAFPLWQKADIRGVIMSMKPLDERNCSLIALYRGMAKPDFSPRENRIAHIVLSGVPWLHAEGWPEEQTARMRRLSPRQRMALGLLLQGYSRDRIAAHLKISPHTANDYVKGVYKHFNVNSQTQLVALFHEGDGGDG